MRGVKNEIVCRVSIFAAGLFIFAGAAPAQSEKASKIAENTTASVTLSSGQVVTARSRKGVLEQIGLLPNEVVDIAVQYPPEAVGHEITAEPLDGGKMIGPSKKLVVGNDGIVQLKFHAGKDPGVYQISLHDGAQELGVQFWIPDPEEPAPSPSPSPVN